LSFLISRALAALGLSLTLAAQAAPPTYRIEFVDLATPDWRLDDGPVALNDRGEVLILRPYWERLTYVVWTPKTGGLHQWHSRLDKTSVHAFNTAGQVGGMLADQTAFVGTRQGGVQPLGALSPGRHSDVKSLNNLGMAAGSSGAADGQSHAFVWSAADGMVDLHPAEALESGGLDINRNAQVAGYVVGANGERHAAVLARGAPPQDLGCIVAQTEVAAKCHSEAVALNDRGQVIGNMNPFETSRAFIWSAVKGLREIEATHGGHTFVIDINNAGQVVGRQWQDGQDETAFYWDATHGARELWSLVDAADPLRNGFTSFFPTAINQRGQIVGAGIGPAGIGTVLLTPVR
jgi:probable HAF family extracellular repeat protein